MLQEVLDHAFKYEPSSIISGESGHQKVVKLDSELELGSIVSWVGGGQEIVDLASKDEFAGINGWVGGLNEVVKGASNVELASVVRRVRSRCNLRNLLSEHLYTFSINYYKFD